MASFAAISRSLMALVVLLVFAAQPAFGANKILVTHKKHVEAETLALSKNVVQEEDQQQRQRAEALARHQAEATGASIVGGSIFAILAVGMLCIHGSKPNPASAQRLLASGGVVKV
eukprot:TRINITY_DN314_c0_g1_i3.p1 TRINITY_DN314_c0_g1~~TRINITY_DN314_c0_g1_i3.p1  ORF type:complete len:116 (+),score=36.48 TRINITY_DN314_c0_g1_i3:199-546(+)